MHLNKFLTLNADNSKVFLGPGEEIYKKKFIMENDKLYFYSNSKILKSYYDIKYIF